MIYLKILEFGNPRNEKMILIHGFESPYQVWEDYIKYFEKDYFIIVPILTGHNPEIKEDFVSFESEVKELEQYYINKFGNDVYVIYGMSMGGIVASMIWKNKTRYPSPLRLSFPERRKGQLQLIFIDIISFEAY